MKLKLDDLPEAWQAEVIRLRRECAAHRREKIEARRAHDALAERVAEALQARANA
jgi:hypothetical protein